MTRLPGDLGERVHVRLEPLVALGDPGEALDGAAVEPGSVLERPFQLVQRDGDALDDPHDVRELELDEPDVVLLGRIDLGQGFRVRSDIDHQCPLLSWRSSARGESAILSAESSRHSVADRCRRRLIRTTESGADRRRNGAGRGVPSSILVGRVPSGVGESWSPIVRRLPVPTRMCTSCQGRCGHRAPGARLAGLRPAPLSFARREHVWREAGWLHCHSRVRQHVWTATRSQVVAFGAPAARLRRWTRRGVEPIRRSCPGSADDHRESPRATPAG